jgi:putative transposase
MASSLARPGRVWQALLMRTKSLSHSVYRHLYHIVWGTKRRKKYLKEYVKQGLIKSFQSTIEKYPTLQIDLVNVNEDHVHIQIEIPPNISVSKAVQALKQHSSFDLKKKYKFIDRMYLENSIWGVGYFSSTVGLNEKQIRKYIEYQEQQEIPKQVDL